MGSRWLPRLVAAGAAAGVLMLAAPAYANSNIDINEGNVPTTASGFKNQECSDNLGGGPYADQDVWVFVLPGNHDTSGDFVTVTATWSTPGGDVTKTIPTDGGDIVLLGVSKAWIATPAGWTLTGATAEITGTAEFFNLTHTCPASNETTPPTNPPTNPPRTTAPPTNPEESPSTSPGGLPVTGTAVAGIVTTGVVLVGLGVGLMVMHRRRTLTESAE